MQPEPNTQNSVVPESKSIHSAFTKEGVHNEGLVQEEGKESGKGKEVQENEKGKVLWTPKNIESTKMYEFMQIINRKYHLDFSKYEHLYDWSIKNISNFWHELFQYFNIIHSQTYTSVVDENARMDSLPEWFPGLRLNYAENLLKYRDDHVALISTNESHSITKLTYAQLYQSTKQLVHHLKQIGIKPNDVVAGYLPNTYHSIIAMLATSAVGAIWTCCSPDFGPQAVLERFKQTRPRVLVCVDGVLYNLKKFGQGLKLRGVLKELSTVEEVIMISNIGVDVDISSTGIRVVKYEDIMTQEVKGDIEFEQLPFQHPLYILYSSGTTGSPKCITHSQGGILLQHMKEHQLHSNINRDSVFFYYTTTGWMMWNWLVSGLAQGCTIVLYDGSPFMPKELYMFELCDVLGVTHFGISAKYLQTLQEKQYIVREEYKLSSLIHLYSTGSPLLGSTFEYVYRCIKGDILLGSITGGTDLCSLFAGMNPILPVRKGEIQCICLGMSIKAYTDSGVEVKSGEEGELVCTKVWPTMPVCFWGDFKNEVYLRTYFRQGVWYHGDYISIKESGGVVMLGRSDGTLKPAGVRFGSSEIYGIMEHFQEVEDSLCVGQRKPEDNDERVILFIKMKEGYTLTQEVVQRVKKAIRDGLSPRHVPAVVKEVRDIPYTMNGKKVEVGVKRIISGGVYDGVGLRNPECLVEYREINF